MSTLKLLSRHHPVRADRIFFIRSLVTTALVAGCLNAQQFVDVRSALKENLMGNPGSVLAIGLRVMNLSQTAASYKPVMKLPAGWRMVTRDFSFNLAPGAGDVRLISFSIPVDARSRQYDIVYSVTDAAGHEGRITLPVIVLPVIDLSLEVVDAPRFVVAGGSFSTTFVLTNNGNAPTPIRLRYRSSSGFPIALDSAIRSLGARDSRQVVLTVSTDAKSVHVSHTLEVDAISARDTTRRVRASSVVQVVPSPTRAEDAYYTFPVTARAREVGQGRLFGPQLEAGGSGSLGERGRDRFEFLFRGPETQTRSVLGLRDEYHVSYHGDRFDAYAGDMNYTLSTLTELGRYATGVSGRTGLGDIDAGAFYNWNRWTTQQQNEVGGFMNYDVTKTASVGLNLFRRQDYYKSSIASLRALLAPVGNSTVDLEYGSGTKDGNRGDAYAARFNGSLPWVAYDMRFIHAGPKFGGYYQDINFLSGSINLQATRSLRLETYAREETRNLNRDTNQVHAPNDRYFQVGTALSDIGAIYVVRSIHRDLLPNPQYDREEDLLQARFGYTMSTASFYVYGDYGSTRDKIVRASFPYRRLALNLGFRPAANYSCAGSLEYSNGQDVYTSLSQERLSGSLNAGMLLGKATTIEVNAYGSRLFVSPVQSYVLAEGSIEHVLPFGHTVTLRARESVILIGSVSTNNEVAYALEYALPLAIPVKKITSVGQLRGLVQDERGRGIAGVLVSAGDNAALTNRKGEFIFSSVNPGSVFVSVDRASMGLDRTTTQPMPYEVVVRGGETATLGIGVTRSVQVTGTVELPGRGESAAGDTSAPIGNSAGQAGVLLELTNGKDYNRRISDSHGRFTFADIRPGVWRLSVIGGNIPEYHSVVPESLTLDLRPGEQKDVPIRLVPRKRAIRILQEGTIVPGGAVRPEQTTQSPTGCMISFDSTRNEFILQVSSWVTRTRARQAAANAEEISGLKSFTVLAQVPNVGRRYRVFLGGFHTREAAEAVCANLMASEKVQGPGH